MGSAPKVLVDLGQLRHTGEAAILMRMRLADKANVDDAARMVNMTQSQFVRTVVIQAAEEIMGITDEPTMDPSRPPGAR